MAPGPWHQKSQYLYYQRRIRKIAYDDETKDFQSPTAQERAFVSFSKFPNVSSTFGTKNSLEEMDSAAPFHPDAMIRTKAGTTEIYNTISEFLLQTLLKMMCYGD